jgi:hypothetical protein
MKALTTVVMLATLLWSGHAQISIAATNCITASGLLYMTSSSNLVSISNAVKVASGLWTGMTKTNVDKYMGDHGMTNMGSISLDRGRTLSCPYTLGDAATSLVLEMECSQPPPSGLFGWKNPLLKGAYIQSQGANIIFITLAEGEHGAEQTPSSQPATQISLNAAVESQSANYELAALLKRLGESKDTGDVERDASGNINSVALRWTNANNRALFLISTLGSLRELRIQGRGIPDEWTREGISYLRKMTNLVSLRVACVGPDIALKDGVFEEICNLRRLKSLSLVAACPERSEYVALTNLQNLAELNVSYAVNFGDCELCLLTNLVNLRNLTIYYSAVSREGTNVLSRMQRLTNATVRLSRSLP